MSQKKNEELRKPQTTYLTHQKKFYLPKPYNYQNSEIGMSLVNVAAEKRRKTEQGDSSCKRFFKIAKQSSTIPVNNTLIPANLNQLIQKFKNISDDYFIYLTYTYEKSNKYFTPYSLSEVPYSLVDKSEFFTMSRHGVTYISSTEKYIINLKDWERNYVFYCKIIELPTFSQFRLRKTFKLWCKKIRRTKFTFAKNVLKENLFFAIPDLAEAALKLRKECESFLERLFRTMEYVTNSSIQEWNLFDFIKTQRRALKKFQEDLNNFRHEAKLWLFQGGLKVMTARGFNPYTKPASSTELHKMDKFNKLYQKFLRYCDYIVISFLHLIARNIIDNAVIILSKHDTCGPTEEELWQNERVDIDLEKTRPEKLPQKPLFIVELDYKEDKVEVEPSELIMLESILELVESVFEALSTFESLATDTIYIQLLKGGKQMDDTVSYSTNSFNMALTTDVELQSKRDSIIEIIQRAYSKVEIYLSRFEPIRVNYKNDVQTDLTKIREEKDIETLRNYCKRYQENMEILDKILPIINLGLLEINQNKLKYIIAPVYQNLLNVLQTYIPRLATQEIRYVSEKTNDLISKLDTIPLTTTEYVNYIRFLDKAEPDVNDIVNKIDHIYALFKIIKDFKFQVEQQEKKKFTDCDNLVIECKNIFTKKQTEKQDLIIKLSEAIQQDIRHISKQLQEISIEIQDPKFIDKNSDKKIIKSELDVIADQLNELSAKAHNLRSFQKEFKIDISRFDELDKILQEVRIRQNLWNTITEWEAFLIQWQNIDFFTLDVEELKDVITKTINKCSQFDRNLPQNELVPHLRENTEYFREKLPIITCLRNPNLKARHWPQIEQLLDRKLYQQEDIKLPLFDELNAYNEEVARKLIEISYRASEEAEFENKLKELENIWEKTIMSIVPHKHDDEAYILAGIDDLQIIIDEVNISVNNIAASRHIDVVKPEIQKWLTITDQLYKTMDELLTCQTNWMYLQAIFSAPDIQRQIPIEARTFAIADKNWKELMSHAYKMNQAFPFLTNIGNYNILQTNNSLLESVIKRMEAYLEMKRSAFPRFFFLSNDELLEILAETRNPQAIQPFLMKLFDAIFRIEFGSHSEAVGYQSRLGPTNDIIAMISPQNERLKFGKGLRARGAVEDWLGKVEEEMFSTVKRYMTYGYLKYPLKKRHEWFKDHPNQVVLTVSQQQWAAEVHTILESSQKYNTFKEMKKFQERSLVELSTLAAITTMKIPPLLRTILCALITIDVHAKDAVSILIENNVENVNDFNWLKMLRYYWLSDSNTMTTRMASASIPYFYEYLGASGVLVITPLTDRCYLCLTGALQMDLGGSPAGPAGTGKTETTKDLSKALAKQCVVFNCSEGLDYKIMGRFFTGLAQCGAWCCFDEFNRINIEVLSVIAQQIITIRNAKASKAKRFIFEGREIKLNRTCAIFVTMNPGYVGRTELPDNLKALFRPIAMMVPDYALISEVILYSEGFEEPKILAHKMVQMYKLCSEQLSQQNHYDFGMRAVKSVLVMAGSLKRSLPDQSEVITLISALQDSNLPKFLTNDAVLFEGIINDLFPHIEITKSKHYDFEKALVECIATRGLQPVPSMILKCVQLYETMLVRWGVMLVGPTGGGKTSVLHSLADTLEHLQNSDGERQFNRKVHMHTLNPKSVTLDELYGTVDSTTLEWRDGLLGLAVRNAIHVTEEIHQWIICDGPVDAGWIENMNSVLDDNKILCLSNSERIKLSPWIHMIFEVQDLAQASPATVSRCGMVYVNPEDLGWTPLIESWTIDIKSMLPKDILEQTLILIRKYFNTILEFDRKGTYLIYQTQLAKVIMFCKLFTALIIEAKWSSISLEKSIQLIREMFCWVILWAIGSNYDDDSRTRLELHIRTALDNEINMPKESLWNYKINCENQEWENWSQCAKPFSFEPDAKFYELYVPTNDTEKFSYISNLLFLQKYPVMFTGESGVGKSVLAATTTKKLTQNNFISVPMTFSSQTTSEKVQKIIEANLQKVKRTHLAAPKDKTVIFFIDDINMPKLDTYGSQPPIELLRQLLDFRGFYDRKKLYWTQVSGVLFGAACAPPGGGRNPMTSRFIRHFALLTLPKPNEKILHTIFSSILKGFFSDFNSSIKILGEPIAKACIELYSRIATELLPTPDKSHYVFNLRDLTKCVQGILQSDSSNYVSDTQILRLYYHETLRVFHDRLINDADKKYFHQLIKEVSQKHFKKSIVQQNESILFGDFMIFGQAISDRIYEEIRDRSKLESILADYLDSYNIVTGQDMKLIFFEDAVEHTVRMARLLRAVRGNGLIVGVAGMGKQSLTKLAAHINGFSCMQIELTMNYNQNAFREDLKNIYRAAGIKNKGTVFLLPDTDITEEDFLEDVSIILNSGEIPDLFEGDDYEKVLLDIREDYDKAINDSSRDAMFKFFMNRARNNLHVVITMSQVGGAFRRRCRMFPSLVNCCTIDWFDSWPSEALFSVALGVLEETEPVTEKRIKLANASVYIHKTTEESSIQFFKEHRRYYHTTPSSYLELLKMYKSLLKIRFNHITSKRKRISTGLDKIFHTNELVVGMQKDLEILIPEQEKHSLAMKGLLHKLEVDTKNLDEVKKAVVKDEIIAKEKAAISQVIADEAQKDLEIAMPGLREAEDALKSLNKTDINEIRAFPNPPQLVQFVMEAVCILLDVKPSWASAKAVMADVNFLKRLVEFDKEHIPDATLRKIKKYIDNKDFAPMKIEKISKVAKSVCQWVIAIDKFARVYKIVEPKIKRREAAESDLQSVLQILRSKQQQLADVEAEVQALKDKIEEKTVEFNRIQTEVNLTTDRINRAERLTSALSEETIGWTETVKNLDEELVAVPGDVLIASACVVYLGAFTYNFRKTLTQKWIENCTQSKIPSSKQFDLINVLGDQYELRTWAFAGLPRDLVSIENGIYATRAIRWPLIIDPQEQANRWIRNLEEKNNLHVCKYTDTTFIRTLEMCVRQGYPLLIEELQDYIDPTLRPVLQRSTFMVEGITFLKIADISVVYNDNFKLYMTTKMANPHYMPEVCINVTLINFSVTPTGLEDQLLADIGAIEQPQLEEQRNEVIVKINSNNQKLLLLEDKVLQILYQSQGNILDDEELVQTLNEVKETSLIIAARLVDMEETEATIIAIREKYRPLASLGTLIYFVISSLAEINPMYEYSLKYFIQLFGNVLKTKNEHQMAIEDRVVILKHDELLALHSNISRSLFEAHKLVFTFLLAVAIEKHAGNVLEEEYDSFIRGAVGTMKFKEKPENLSIDQRKWENCQFLESHFQKSFNGLTENICNGSITITIGDFDEVLVFVEKPHNENYPWNEKLTSFQKVMLIKFLRPEHAIASVSAYVRLTLGKSITESKLKSDLKTIYRDTSNVTPLIFVLSQGSDPMSTLLKFTAEMKFLKKFYSVSLGQGQGPIAENLIDKSVRSGNWVFLQNCHLASSWMKNMENIVRNITLGTTRAHLDFRLFLSTMPTNDFPVSVLQSSVKTTNEPPRGLKSNLLRSLNETDPNFFEQHVLGWRWRALIFSVFIFHAVIIERKKFGPLGWNISYEFNESDRECGMNILNIFVDSKNSATGIPWDAITYINSEITWGGRVTDYWDQRCLKTIMKIFFSPQILQNDYVYSKSRTYKDPRQLKLDDYKNYVMGLPWEEDPELLGMHQNASIVYQTKETSSLISTLLVQRPKVGREISDDEVVIQIIEQIFKKLAKKIDIAETNLEMLKTDKKGRIPSFTTVLLQEIERYNILLKIVHENVTDLSNSINGLTVMSETIEENLNSIRYNIVPKLWSSRGFLSIKSLTNWIIDFIRRIGFIQDWQRYGKPKSIWISGFYFPQAFLTGILQTHARQFSLPIDSLKLDFDIINTSIDQQKLFESHQLTEYKGQYKSYGELMVPDIGVFVHGLFLEAAYWDENNGGLCDSRQGELFSRLPVIWFKPCKELDKKGRYEAPLYKTQARAGVLSTTGHSTNFVHAILLKSKFEGDFWILRGTALVTAVSENLA